VLPPPEALCGVAPLQKPYVVWPPLLLEDYWERIIWGDRRECTRVA